MIESTADRVVGVRDPPRPPRIADPEARAGIGKTARNSVRAGFAAAASRRLDGVHCVEGVEAWIVALLAMSGSP